MLDYSLNKEGAKNFILYFDEDEENLTVHLADGKEYPPVPNTEENKAHILQVMENQVDDTWRFEEKQKKAKKSDRNWLIYDAIFLTFNTVMMIINPTILTGVAIACFLLSTGLNTRNYLNCNKKLKDIEKNKLFLYNKKRINEYLKKGNEEVKEETLNPVKDEDKTPVLNINDVHNMSYENVNQILADIERDEKFGIDRPKVLAMRYTSNNNNKKK